MEPGGRFRLDETSLRDCGEWSWQQNPFVGSKPYQGLLAILMMVNSTDLKNSNNTLYEYRSGDFVQPWYVVRDLGAAFGTTARIAPLKGDAEAFSRQRFILDVRNGFVRFDYHGWHQDLIRDRIRPADAAWASGLLSGLSDRQWLDAFSAGGFTPEEAAPFIQKMKANIVRGMEIGRGATPDPS
jgi:hypothetical protein